jgi:hypothetical protein
MCTVSARPSSVVLLGVGMNPPSSMISLSVMSSFASSSAVAVSSVFSAGFPISLLGGRMNPRAPFLVFGGDLAELVDVPEFVGFAELALANRTGVGVPEGHEPVLDRLAGDALGDLLDHLRAAIRELLQCCGGLQLRAGATATSSTASPTRRSSTSPTN